MARKRYTADERSAALAIYAEHGPTVAEERTGIPKGTIASWANRTGTHTVCNATTAAATEAARLRWEERRTALAERIGATAEYALERCEQALEVPGSRELRIIDHDAKGAPYDRIPTPADAKALATTMAILVDKAQLLTGGSTSRHEHVTAESDVDAEIRQLTDDLALNDRAAA